MEALDLARWQFGITTVYHFILVPLTIGLSILVAIMQTAWVRTGKEKWLRLTKFYGKLLLINFALGVATGIVQEFQFGMNWSEYSRYVGDIFGAPLAMEALVAFFLESTFLGVWIFGWDRLSKKVHLATVWLFAIGANLSAYFIIAANSWMQHPVGTEYNPETGRAEMTNIWAVLTNSTTLAAFPHVIATAFLVAGSFVAGIAGFWMVKKAKADKSDTELPMYRTALRFGAVTMIIAGIAVIYTGDVQAKLMFEQQPMKMAAAEGIMETEDGAAFSLLSLGNLAGNDPGSVRHVLSIPGLTSYLAEGDFGATVTGLNELQRQYAGTSDAVDPVVPPLPDYQVAGDTRPNLAVTYWSFRLMIGLAAFSAAVALSALWLTRKGAVTDKQWFSRLAVWSIPAPFLAASFGWIFTEMGRQPFVVAPNPSAFVDGVDQVYMLTQHGVSLAASNWEVLTSMVIFTLIYAILGVFWYRLMVRYAQEGAPVVEDSEPSDDADRPLSFAY